MFLTLIMSNSSFQNFMVTGFRVMFKKFLPTSKTQRYSLFFFSECFIIFVFMLKSVVHIKVQATSDAMAVAVS